MNVAEFFTMFAVHIALVVFCLGYLLIGAVSIRYGKKMTDIRQIQKDHPSISVVIPTYNEEQIIASRLDSLLKSRYPADKMEIVIVDSSSDRTPFHYRDVYERPELCVLQLQKSPNA